MLNFNQLRNQITDSQDNLSANASNSAQANNDNVKENSLKLKIGLTYKLEHAQNRLLVETEINDINDLRTNDPCIPESDNDPCIFDPSIHVKLKEKATKVLEALSFEFKLFKELTSKPDPNLWRLIAYHSKMERTFEVQNLTVQVSCFYLLQWFRTNKKTKIAAMFCSMVFAESTGTRSDRRTLAAPRVFFWRMRRADLF